MGFKEIECEGLCSVHMSQDRIQKWGLVNMVIDRQAPYKARNLPIRLATVSFEASVKGSSFSPEIFLPTAELRESARPNADFGLFVSA
jgi:hypothetical protein